MADQAERSVEHATIVVERHLDASPARVFAAWADPALRKQWDNPGKHWVVVEQTQDFKIGGVETSRFGPADNPHLNSRGHFLDIVPDARIVSAGTMHTNDTRLSSTLFTVEFYAAGSRTKLILTDQSVFYKTGETPSDRQNGWAEIVDKLQAFIRK